jgi:hypothetical protein
MAVEWIDFDAENLAAENLAKGIEAAIMLEGFGGDPKLLHLIVRHACGSNS